MLAIDGQSEPDWSFARAAVADMPSPERERAESAIRRLSEWLAADFHRLVNELQVNDVKVFVIGGLMEGGPPADVVEVLSRTMALDAAGFLTWQVV